MKNSHVRAFIAIVVVGVFMTITATLALYPVFTSKNVNVNLYADFFAKTTGVYTGIVGVIIGYYFGKMNEAGTKGGQDTPPPTA